MKTQRLFFSLGWRFYGMINKTLSDLYLNELIITHASFHWDFHGKKYARSLYLMSYRILNGHLNNAVFLARTPLITFNS